MKAKTTTIYKTRAAVKTARFVHILQGVHSHKQPHRQRGADEACNIRT